MSTFTRRPTPGGDSGIWDQFQLPQDYISLSLLTTYLYSNAGALTLSKGNIGLDDGSQAGVVIVDTVTTISLVGLTASCWARIEVSRSGTTPTIAITSIAGETNPAALPASFTGGIDAAKGGFYISSMKRVLGLAWINAAGALTGIINCQTGIIYSGYSVSDDAGVMPYYFQSNKTADLFAAINTRTTSPQTAAFTANPVGADTFFPVTTGASSFNSTVPAASANMNGKKIRIQKVDAGAGIVTAIRSGADTWLGATAFPMRVAGDFIELWCDGTAWRVIDSLSTITSAALAINQIQTLAHGMAARPRKLVWSLLCLSIEASWAVSDEIFTFPTYVSNRGYVVTADATNVITISEATNAFAILDKSTDAITIITMAKWAWRIRYSL